MPPKKRARKRRSTDDPQEQEQPQRVPCDTPGCKLPALPGQKTCVAHSLCDTTEDWAKREAARAKRNGDLLKAALFGFAPSAIAILRPLVSQAAVEVSRGQVPFRRAAPRSPTPPPSPPDPFAALGLEPSATIEEVRERQRQYAQIFHPDRGGGPAAAAKLAEINAAAAEALKRLR